LKKILLISLILFAQNIYAQKEANNWYFGYEAGISFDGEQPKALFDSKLSTLEGCATMSDSLGNLLFYTNGITVWNKNHVIMQNGIFLSGHLSSTHSAYILKQPKSKLYYLFTLDEISLSTNWGVRYSIIDLEANNGKGSVIEKNTFLLPYSSEKITSTKHRNNEDFWVIIPQTRTKIIYVYKLTKDGLSKKVLSFNIGEDFHTGQIKMSSNGKKLAMANRFSGQVSIFDFNTISGEISKKTIIKTVGSAYGIEFSPNSKYLYVALITQISKLYQCPVESADTLLDIETDCIKIVSEPPQKQLFGQLQLAPNKKIYLSMIKDSVLAIINSPDSLGKLCDFDYNGLDLKYRRSGLGLPSFDKSYIINPSPFVSAKQYCLGDTTLFSLNYSQADSTLWKFGDGEQQSTASTVIKHRYKSAGNYTVNAIGYQQGTPKDTLVYALKIYSLPALNLGNDTLLCASDSLYFNLQHPSISRYQWSFGDTVPTATLKTEGQYWVQISNDGCTATDTLIVKTINACAISTQNHCFGDTTLFTIPTTNADSIKWDYGNGTGQTTANAAYYQYPDSGTYKVIAKQYIGGVSRIDTKTIIITKVSPLQLGNDTILCEGKNLQINTIPQYDSYIWNDGTNTPVKAITKAGIYWMEVEKNGCKSRDSITVKTFNCFLNIKNTCLGDTTVISFDSQPIDSIEWLFGNNTQQVVYTTTVQHIYATEGDYTVTAKVYLGKEFILLNAPLKITKTPQIQLSTDTALCENQRLKTIQINDADIAILWSDGSTALALLPAQSGQYILSLEKEGCLSTDTIQITLLNCGCELYFPNAFTPNNNGLNEQFMPVTECLVKQFQLDIFNKWGQLIFQSSNIGYGWDGNYKGKPAPNGTYLWIARYKSEYTGKIYNQKGSVLILR